MLSKTSIKDNKGISNIAIIIIIVVVIVALIAGIVFFVLSSKQNKTVTEPIQEEQNVIWDTNNEITLEEKNILKNDYLGAFSLLASENYSSDEEKQIATAVQILKMKENDGNTSEDLFANPTSSLVATPTASAQTNTVENTTTTSEQTTVVNETIVVTGDNPLSPNTSTTIGTSTNSVGTNTAVENVVSNTETATETLDYDSEELAIAINEITGKSAGNVNISSISNKKIIPGFATDILSITKDEGVYDITYKVCFPQNLKIKKFGTVDKYNTSALDKLDSTTLKIQLVRNRTPEYSEYQVKSIEKIETTTPVAYYLSNTNGKFGVIDEAGNVIVQNMYDWIMIPNSYKDIFICQTGGTTEGSTATFTVLNKEGSILYEDYSNISLIRSTNGATEWYENDFLVYQKNGKFGAIDFDGFEVFEPIYDKIEPLYYFTGKLILTQNGKQALGDTTGKVISNSKYTKIGVLGGQFDINSLVTSQRTLEQVQQMMQTGMYIVGQDVDGLNEIIEVIKPEEYNADFADVQTVNNPTTISDWQYQNVQGYSIYVK